MLLVSRYGRVMPHGATHVLWRDLVRDIEEAFTTAGMEKDPDLQVKRQVFGEQRPIELRSARGACAGDTRRVAASRRGAPRAGEAALLRLRAAGKLGEGWITSRRRWCRHPRCTSSSQPRTASFERHTLNDGTVNYIALVRDIDPYEAFSSRNVTQHTFPHDQTTGKCRMERTPRAGPRLM